MSELWSILQAPHAGSAVHFPGAGAHSTACQRLCCRAHTLQTPWAPSCPEPGCQMRVPSGWMNSNLSRQVQAVGCCVLVSSRQGWAWAGCSGSCPLLLCPGVEGWLGHLSIGCLNPSLHGASSQIPARIRGIVWVPGGSGWSEVLNHQGARQAAHLPPSEASALDLLV